VKAFVKVTVVVLIVIGVGVATVGGLSSLLGPARPYGKYPFRFSAAYPTYAGGRLSFVQLPHIPATPSFVGYTVLGNDYWASVVGARTDTPLGWKLLHSLLAPAVKGYRTRTVSTDGKTTTLAKPTCDNHEQPYAPSVCSDVEIVRDGNVTWIVSAAAPNAPAFAQDFLRSFHPG
jgi:hypothetical protein